MSNFHVFHGDAIDIMRQIPDASIDAIICDPPYPEIDRDYGVLTEEAWHSLMHGVVDEARRVLTQTGSAVFIIQPNYERIGRTRPWPFKFMTWAAEEWNLIEDAYWWNFAAIPGAGCERKNGLLRRSIKLCIWLGPEDCYRNQGDVLWGESERGIAERTSRRVGNRRISPSGSGGDPVQACLTAQERGGVTPFNLIPIAVVGDPLDLGFDHPARTPVKVCDWWVRYISPPGGIILDPFCGSGSVGLAALLQGRSYIGIEQHEHYADMARKRIAMAGTEVA